MPTDGSPVRVVTVSATYGAGGTVVAPLLAERLGLPFADRLIHPHSIAPVHSAEGVTEEELDEEPMSIVLGSLALLSPTYNLPAPMVPEDLPDRTREGVEASIQALLDGGGAVILGRAAAAALGHRPGAFHVRLDGPKERRARRGAAWEGIDLDAAAERLSATDAVRTRYTRRLYHHDPNDPSLYHLVIDATVLSADACVDVVARAAEGFWAYDDDQMEAGIAASRARLAGRQDHQPRP